MTPEVVLSDDPSSTKRQYRICLALSGGGFRASLFHLGVIRRLEELGIMKDVDAISAVSGGSIVAAFYVCQMEKRLREIDPNLRQDTATRVQLFEKIAEEFLKGVDHNLRTRALVFTPFFHPILFIKTLLLKPFRTGARSELIQREYDRWFYHQDTIDQLPSVTPEQNKGGVQVIHGPRMFLNTTSLLTGERVSYSREPVSGMTEMKNPNKNIVPLSRVVGASSGVPVVFPPTHIFGDILVDGGVADNQGIEALLARAGCNPSRASQSDAHEILLISDASGQMDPIHTIRNRETDVFFRVNDILQYQVRSKLIDRLVDWHEQGPQFTHYFAFTHLYLNLKDRGVVERLPAEMIPGVARIRTDLDQFSVFERDALMYHGYTTIDAQIARWCKPLREAYCSQKMPPLAAPPLFSENALQKASERDFVRRELETGKEKLFLLRSLKNYPAQIAPVFVVWLAAFLGSVYALLRVYRAPLQATQNWLVKLFDGATSNAIGKAIDWLFSFANVAPIKNLTDWVAAALAVVIIVALAGYVLAFPMYLMVRRISLLTDRTRYKRFAHAAWTPCWSTTAPAPTLVKSAAAGSGGDTKRVS